MTFIVIPHETGTTTAMLWIGAIYEGDVPHKPVWLDMNGELGETRAWIGDATWKRLDRPTVEALVGGKV